MVKILTKGGFPVFRDGALVTVATDATGCGCCGEAAATCGTTPTDLTVDTTGATYTADAFCFTGTHDSNTITTEVWFQSGTCPDGWPVWGDGPNTFQVLFADYGGGGAWHCEIRLTDPADSMNYGTQWYGIKTDGSSPLGIYVPDITMGPDCGGPMTGTVVVS